MDQDERAVLDPFEGNTEQGNEASTPATSPVLADEGASGSQVYNSVRGAGSESAKKQYVEEPSPESDKVANEDPEALENPVAIRFEFRSAAADMTRPSASLHGRSRGGKQAGPMRFAAAADAERAGAEAGVLGASSSSAPATGTHEDVTAMADGHKGATPGYDKKLKRACSASPGARVAIMQASPRDSYRRVPWRSRKHYSPKRFVAPVGASPSAAAPPAGDRSAPVLVASPGSTLPSASVSWLRTESSSVIDASASSSSNRPPSRGRKQPRPEHFIPEEDEATASAKARRSDIFLDRFLSSLVHGSQSSASEWVRNVTAEDATVRGQHRRCGEGFRIRDASRHAARALSRLGCAGPSGAPGSPPGEPDGRGRIYGVLAILGASLALTVATFVLFYIVGQRGEPGPSAEKPDE